jgi:hypothetical protein
MRDLDVDDVAKGLEGVVERGLVDVFGETA